MSIRNRLLESFDGEKNQTLSGEILASKLGVSRTAVWKHMQALKNAGIPIESTGRQGYRFRAPFDNSLVAFRGPAWATYHYFLTTNSTQTLAKAGGAAGLPEGHLWVAELQSKGRGRLEREWESAYGGLWFSLLLRPKLAAAKIPPLTLVAGLALCESIKEVSLVEAKLKWPNDVVVGGKKIAGILTEMSGQVERTDWVVIGVGLDVHNSLSKKLAGHAASLYTTTGKVWARAEFLKMFLKKFHNYYLSFQKEGFRPFQAKYWDSYFAADQPVQLKTAYGIVTGIARGVDDSGALMIESRRKIQSISEGEIII